MQSFYSEVQVQAPRPFAFEWHEGEHAFERLNPPWDRTELLEKNGNIESGTVKLRARVGPLWIGIQAKHSKFVRNEQFFDEMLGGPFSHWEHLHRFESSESGGCFVKDEIEYKIRGGFLGQWVAGRMVRSRLQQLFAYRRIVTQREIEDHFQFSDQSPKTIAVTGSTGLVGRAICHFLKNGGHRVIPLQRARPEDSSDQPCWDPATGKVYFGAGINSVDCFLHLAGYSIADKRWNANIKDKIRESRVDATQKLARAIVDEKRVTESFVCASATGFYGDRHDEELTEESKRGVGFLADTCEDWEAACQPIRSAGIRVVNMRFGMILSAVGGALSALLTPFKLGAGGRAGSGKQYWSWISFFDTLRAIHFSIMNQSVSGPVNFVTENPVKQRDFAKILGKVLFRPSFMPLPAWGARLALGEMADYLILASSRVIPKKLAAAGFQFVHPQLEDALRFELGRIQPTQPQSTSSL